MRKSPRAALLLVCTFATFFAVSFLLNRNYPMQVVAGEKSQATWMSGVLLVMSATLSLVIGIQKQWFPWFAMFVFFFLLAIDEHFMLHEMLKDEIIFSLSKANSPRLWMAEAPVIIGSILGCVMTYVIWINISGASRTLLLCVLALGITSVIIDILTIGVFWEECCKLIAELLMCLLLLREMKKS